MLNYQIPLNNQMVLNDQIKNNVGVLLGLFFIGSYISLIWATIEYIEPAMEPTCGKPGAIVLSILFCLSGVSAPILWIMKCQPRRVSQLEPRQAEVTLSPTIDLESDAIVSIEELPTARSLLSLMGHFSGRANAVTAVQLAEAIPDHSF